MSQPITPAPAVNAPVPPDVAGAFDFGWATNAIEMALKVDSRVTELNLVHEDLAVGIRVFGFKVGDTDMSLTVNITQ